MKISKTEYAVLCTINYSQDIKNLTNLKRSWFKIKKKMSDFIWIESIVAFYYLESSNDLRCYGPSKQNSIYLII
jgi:hypothetical protein